MRSIDVTRKVEWHEPTGDNLPLIKCVCKNEFEPWAFILGVHPYGAAKCPKCGRRLFFAANIRVFEVRG